LGPRGRQTKTRRKRRPVFRRKMDRCTGAGNRLCRERRTRKLKRDKRKKNGKDTLVKIPSEGEKRMHEEEKLKKI